MGWNENEFRGRADVTDEQASSAPNSLHLRVTSDVVKLVEGVTSGRWAIRGEVYIPSDHTGTTWFILLNTYSHGGPRNWSTELAWNTEWFGHGGPVEEDRNDPELAPTITDRWVPFEVLIDFDAYTQVISYNGAVLQTVPWDAQDDSHRLEGVDLYHDGDASGNAGYFDNLELVWLDAPAVPALSAGRFVLLGLLLLTVAAFASLSARRRRLASP